VADSLPLLYHRHLTAPVPSLVGVPPWLQHVVERLLAKAPHERYQSADEVLADLDARRVLARELPALARRECLACGAATLADLPLCTGCGHDAGTARGGGMWDVVCTEATDGDALAAWLRDTLGEHAPRVGRRTRLLLAGVDRSAGEVFRQGALRRGIILSVVHRSAFTLAKKVFSFVGLVASLWIAAASFWNAAQIGDAYPYMQPHVLFLFEYARGIGAALAAWVCFQLFRRQAIRPALGGAAGARTYVATEFPWVRELAPNGRVAEGTMQTVLSTLVERRLLFARHVPALDAATRETLDGLLVSACRVAHLAADVVRARQTRPAAAEDALDAEDAIASLLRKLVRVLAVFNRLLGRAIVLRLPIDAADTVGLEECAQDLGTEVEAMRRAGAELRRVA
jgi:hypothetical protein